MYVFMKLQHHGRAVLAFSGEWEGTGGRREEAADDGSQITLPRASPGAGVGGGRRGARGRGLQSGLCLPRTGPWRDLLPESILTGNGGGATHA
ncbi:unnamed protein product [Coccothraustes coccothraustes]